MRLEKLQPIIGLLLILAVWQGATAFGLLDPLFVSSPVQTIFAVIRGFASGVLTTALLATLLRSFGALLIGAFIGVPLGLLVGGVEFIGKSFGASIDAIRSIPGTALFPAFVVLLGLNEQSRMAGPALSALWTICVFTAAGARTAAPGLRFQLQLHKASLAQRFLDGLFMPTLPEIVAGFRVAISLSLVTTIGVEIVVGTNTGLGHQIYMSQLTFRTPEMYAAILLTGLLGITTNAIFSYLLMCVSNNSTDSRSSSAN